MNQDVSSKKVYEVIDSAGNTFFDKLIGSSYWRFQQDDGISMEQDISGIKVTLKIKNFMKPNRTPVLPNDQINPDLLSAGSYFGNVEVNIPNEPKFSIQSPHNRPEDQVHLQKGRNKIILPPPAESITNYGELGSSLFLKFNSKEEAINKIQEIREQ